MKILLRLLVILFLLVPLSCRKTVQALPDIWNIPVLSDFTVDGQDEEWTDIPVLKLWADQTGQYPMPGDLEAWMRVAYTSDGIALMVDVKDDNHYTDTLNPWNGDALEVFISAFRGSPDIVQLSFVALENRLFMRLNDHRKFFTGFPVTPGAFKRENGVLSYEVLIPFEWLGDGLKNMAMQVQVDDSDVRGDKDRQVLQWHPVGHSYGSSFAMFRLEKAKHEPSWTKAASRIKITDNKKTQLRVFGTIKGDVIEVSGREGLLLTKASMSSEQWEPEVIDLTPQGLDIESDSLFISVNGEFCGFHDLFQAPRLYISVPAKPFEREIRNFVLTDRLNPPAKGGVLFIGSSSIRMWYSIYRDFPELNIIHRGFGGSTSEEALMYMDQIVLPYQPAAIVYYEGDNDVPKGFSPEQIAGNVKAFIDKASNNIPGVRIFLISPKPSVNRMHLWKKYLAVHEALIKLADSYQNVEFVDVKASMFDEQGQLRKDLFISDGIHMNEQGYEIWKNTIRRELNLPVIQSN